MMAMLALTACSNQAKPKNDKPLTKSEVISKSQKPFKSGQVIQSVSLSTDTSNQTVIANTTFGGNNGTVFHINNQTTSQGKTSSSEEWINLNNVFINGSSTWYKSDLDKMSGHTYSQLLDNIMNNKIINNPGKVLTKSYKLTRKKDTYTLSADIKDKKAMQKALDPIVTTVGQTDNQQAIFKRLAKYGKYQNMTVKLVVKNKKLFRANIFVNLKIGKLMTAKFGQSFGNFGNNDFLKVPDAALNAKPLPEAKRSQTKKSTQKTTKVIKKNIKKSKK